jgi:transcriptional regulator CtsR
MATTNYVQTTFSVMTKASIVQRLLDEKLITAEEAVVLLQNETPTC